jgi:PAS domain S-box-containing protein
MSSHKHPLESEKDPVADRELLLQRCRELEQENEALKRLASRAPMHENTYDAIIITDPQGRIIYWNKAAESIYGWSMAETVGRSILEVIPAEQSLEEAQQIMTTLRSGQIWSGQFAVRHRDGHQFVVQVTDSALLSPEGQVLAIIGVSHALTAQAQKEPDRELLEKETWALETHKAIAVASESLRSDLTRKQSFILKSVSCGVWEFDPVLSRMELDDALYELYGITREKCPQGFKAVQRAVHPDDRKIIFEDIPRIIESGTDRFDVEYRVLRPDGVIRHVLAQSFCGQNT